MNFLYPLLEIISFFICMQIVVNTGEFQLAKEASPNEFLINEIRQIGEELRRFQEQSQTTYKKVFQILEDLRNKVHDTNARVQRIEVTGIGQNNEVKQVSLNEMMERSLKTMERMSDTAYKRMLIMIGEPQRSNKDIIGILKKIESSQSSVQCSGIGNSSLPQDIKKELAEIISIQFVKMRKRFTDVVERLEDTQRKCSTLTNSVENVNEQCLDRHSKQKNFEELELEVKRNLTRIERDINFRVDQTIMEIENKMKVVNIPEIRIGNHRVDQVKIQEPILPVKPTTIKPKFEVVRECQRKVFITKPEDCAVLRKSHVTCDGTYVIHPNKKKAVIAYCDMTTDGGGWTVIMRRGDYGDVHTNFHQNWKLYKQGFGRAQKEFWLGNENVHLLTSGKNSQQLLVQLESFQGQEMYLTFHTFSIKSEADNYKLHIGNVSGNHQTLASSFTILDQNNFITFDKNETGQTCALSNKAGWWYGDKCDQSAAKLTGPYYEEDDFRENWQGIQWPSWKRDAVMREAQMKIRPNNFHSA